jgi:hypothetical protein
MAGQTNLFGKGVEQFTQSELRTPNEPSSKNLH